MNTKTDKQNLFCFLSRLKKKKQTGMAGAEEIFFVREKAMILDELIQVAKYSNMKKTRSAQPDHGTNCIRPSYLEDFYFANLDLIL